MTRVTVDGVDYFPKQAQLSKAPFAVAITTRNRPDVLANTLIQIERFTPMNIPIIVVDDASDPAAIAKTPEMERTTWHRFTENVGIPRAKNKCLELCMDTGADHFFLLDDDCYPAIDNWWEPYLFAPELHYNYIFTHWSNGSPVGDCVEVYNDGETRAFDQARGCAMFVRREVVEKVGGFNPAFGLGMNEHLEYSKRICAAGLTTFEFQDVIGADEIWYSLDRAQSVTRTLPSATRAELLKRNDKILQSLAGSTDFVEYREMENLVLTTLLTKNIDGQRGTKWRADPAIVQTWRSSIKGAVSVVLVDEIDPEIEPDTFLRVPTGWDIPHLQRWVNEYQYLQKYQANWVWVTDGSDVEMLNEPWTHMERGVLYVGDEPCTIGKPWLAEHHPFYRNWIAERDGLQMLNCGVVGGDYLTVLEFMGDMVRELTRAHGQVDYDMGSFNYVLRQPKWRDKVEHGPRVTTTFKSNERTSAWFRHK